MSKISDLASGIVEQVKEIEKSLVEERERFRLCEERHKAMDVREAQLDSREKGIANREQAQAQAMQQLSQARLEKRNATEREKRAVDMLEIKVKECQVLQQKIDSLTLAPAGASK